jgi:hypothetical protein
MAELTIRTRVALLLAVAVIAAAVGYYLWPTSVPEPRGSALGVIDTPAERRQFAQRLREGRVRLVKPGEIETMLTEEQKALIKRQ